MIDKKTQAELRDRFNPDGSPLRQQQLRMLEILKYIDKVCKENNIRYWLSSGTLLGAVRHGGFIPWDDDLDIEMLREDYLKFVKVFPDSENFALQTSKTDPNYSYNFAKVRDLHTEISEFGKDEYYKYRGLFVDVFCLERIPRCVAKFYGDWFGRTSRWKVEFYNRKIVLAAINIFRKILLCSIPMVRFIFENSTEELRHSYGTGFLKERIYEDIFPLTCIKFEDSSFPAPKDTDNYLKKIFGDYLKLPDFDTIQVHTSSCVFKK